LHHRPHVQAGAADEDGQPAAAVDVGDEGRGQGLELGYRERLIRFEDVDEVVGDFGADGGVDFSRADVHSPVHLHRVAGDDLPVEAARQDEADVGFAHRRRADDGHKALAFRRHCRGLLARAFPWCLPGHGVSTRMMP
jgi:hypothetical protein